MAQSMLGLHWIRVHPDRHDFAHVERMQYPSVKTFEWMHKDRNFCNDLIAAMPKDAYFLARNHPRSEEKQDVWSDPVGTGVRHANAWAIDIANGECHLPNDRTFFLPANELDATTGDRAAIDRYTTAFLDRLQVHGLRGGAFNFSTGHPRTVDGTRNTPADYSVFERSHQAIVRGHHIGVLHIYGTAAVPLVPGHFDRLKACSWQDVEWVVGECAADEHVIGGGAHDGYLRSMSDNPARYCDWLDDFIMGINDPRIHSYQIFSYDYSHPWDSFDTRPIRDALEAYDWQHIKTAATPPYTQHIPSVIAPGPTPAPQEPTATIPYGARIVTTVTANLREWSSIQSPIIREVPPNTVFDMVGYNDDWYQVPRGDGEGDGWLHYSVVKQASPPPQEETGDKWTRSRAFVARWEGEYQNVPNDRGNWTGGAVGEGENKGTKWGISAASYPHLDIKNLTKAQADAIYERDYWGPSGASALAWPACLLVFDTAVLHGVSTARKWQQEVGTNPYLFAAKRLRVYTGMTNWSTWGRGWVNRVSDLLEEMAK